MTPLSVLLPKIDRHWCILDTWGETARLELDQIDMARHVAEFEAARRREDDEDEDDDPYEVVNGVAMLRLTGPLTKRPQSWGTGTSTALFSRAVALADRDAKVKRCCLVIDSPGGQVSGTQRAGDAVAACSKPTVAYVEDMACSGAYWIGSQADLLYCNPTAMVGNIGVVMSIDDTSRMYQNAGITRHVISTGPYKGAGTPGAPITALQLADFQREVDEINEEFVAAVAKGRSLSIERVRELADGRVHIGKQALALGLVDGVCSFDDCLSRLQSQSPIPIKAASGYW